MRSIENFDDFHRKYRYIKSNLLNVFCKISRYAHNLFFQTLFCVDLKKSTLLITPLVFLLQKSQKSILKTLDFKNVL